MTRNDIKKDLNEVFTEEIDIPGSIALTLGVNAALFTANYIISKQKIKQECSKKFKKGSEKFKLCVKLLTDAQATKR